MTLIKSPVCGSGTSIVKILLSIVNWGREIRIFLKGWRSKQEIEIEIVEAELDKLSATTLWERDAKHYSHYLINLPRLELANIPLIFKLVSQHKTNRRKAGGRVRWRVRNLAERRQNFKRVESHDARKSRPLKAHYFKEAYLNCYNVDNWQDKASIILLFVIILLILIAVPKK